jgi:hypothetical protein
VSLYQGVTLLGRRTAEALMESTCTIRRRTGVTTDHSTGVETPVWSVIFAGKCRLRFPFVRPQQVDAAGQVLSQQRGILSVPVEGTAGVRADDVATIDSNPSDSGVVGLLLRVEGPFVETHASARRLPVEVVS